MSMGMGWGEGGGEWVFYRVDGCIVSGNDGGMFSRRWVVYYDQ